MVLHTLGHLIPFRMALSYLFILSLILSWQEDNAVFVMTNMIISPDQKQGTCPEDPNFEGVKCTNDSDCTPLEPVPNGNGKPHVSCSSS